MRAYVTDRVLPVLAVLAALVVVNGVATTMLFSRGFGFMLRAEGVALGALLLLALAALCRLALVRVKKLDAEATGLTPGNGFVRSLGLATVTGALGVAALAGMLTATGAATLRWRGVPWWTAGLGLLAFPLNAAFQQLGLQSLWLAARREGGSSVGAAIVPLALFVAPHAAQSAAPLYVLNVTLFGAATIQLFSRTRPPSYAAPSGLHGGWNLAMMFFGMFPESADLAGFTCTPRGAAWWSGGAAGPESGAAYSLLMLLLVGALSLSPPRSPRA